MGTYSLGLDFQKLSEDEFSTSSISQIYVKTQSIDKNGRLYITPRCVSFHEFDFQISRLQKELEKLRVAAKRKFLA